MLMMNSIVCSAVLTVFLTGQSLYSSEAFQTPQSKQSNTQRTPNTVLQGNKKMENYQPYTQLRQDDQNQDQNMSRRSIIEKGSKLLSIPFILNSMSIENTNAVVGSLPEFSDSNAVLQGLTIDVSDLSQQDDMINFLRDGFGMKLLRQRKVQSVTETWMGFGPEEMKIPDTFELPVSSFAEYGGHASICIRYDSQSIDLYYKKGDTNAPGDNIAYVQLGVPEYRISQMIKNGGNILDAYGIVNVVSPSGLPIRGIVGISPDPMMFVALNCQNVKQSREFYEQLGFVEQEYPFCRPNKGMGQFEPPQPKNSVYVAPSQNSMGVLLLQADRRKKNIKPNPVFRSMNIVYTPSTTAATNDADSSADAMKVLDPSGTGISFQPYELFQRTELSTRVVAKTEG